MKGAYSIFGVMAILTLLAVSANAIPTVDYQAGSGEQIAIPHGVATYHYAARTAVGQGTFSNGFWEEHYRRVGVVNRAEMQREKEDFQDRKERKNWIIIDGQKAYLGNEGYQQYVADVEKDDDSFFAVSGLRELNKNHNRIAFIRQQQPDRYCEGCRYGDGEKVE